jgi:tetratricopeptide (TPR) repeat protein
MSYTRIDTEAEAYIARKIAAGFDEPAQIAELAADIYEADPLHCEALVDQATAALERARLTWPAVTDCDRLDRAFGDLDASGIVARQHFACCNTCGNAEMTDVVHDERELGRTIDGYVFYHWQDTDAAVGGHGLHLRFHAVSHRAAETSAIGKRVVEALRAHGLSSAWDGDPERTIALPSFDWRRRSLPPPYARPVPSAAGAAERWCDDLPRLTVADLADALGETFGETAVAVGDRDRALAWARAHLVDAGTLRCAALARVAAALRGDEAPELARHLMLEALACAPWASRSGAMVELLVGADLDDPEVAAAARSRVLESRRDVRGAVELAWFAVRAGLPADEESSLLEGVEAARRRPDRFTTHTAARAALDAALWVLHARRGETEAAGEARRRLLDLLDSAEIVSLPAFAIRAAVAAAADAGELALVAQQVQVHAPSSLHHLVDAYLRRGDLDAVAALDPHGTWENALLARAAPDDPRAAAWLSQAELAAAQLDALHEEGLYSHGEVQRARFALAAARARHGDRSRAGAELLGLSRALAAELAESVRGTHTFVAEVAAGTRGPALPVDASWFTPEGESKLAAALSKWEAAGESGRFRARRQCATIFEAAAAIARRGDRARARALIERGLRGDPAYVASLWQARAGLVAAWAATEQLDLALDLARETSLDAEALAPLVVALAELGRIDEALGLLGPALAEARSSASLHTLAPAVLAVAADRRACATAMLAALARAEAAARALAG